MQAHSHLRSPRPENGRRGWVRVALASGPRPGPARLCRPQAVRPRPSSARRRRKAPGSSRAGRLCAGDRGDWARVQGAIGFLPVRQSAGEIVRFLTQERSEAVGEQAGAQAEDPARPQQAPRPRSAGSRAPGGLASAPG